MFAVLLKCGDQCSSPRKLSCNITGIPASAALTRSRTPCVYLTIQAVPLALIPAAVANPEMLSEASLIGAMVKAHGLPEFSMKAMIASIASKDYARLVELPNHASCPIASPMSRLLTPPGRECSPMITRIP